MKREDSRKSKSKRVKSNDLQDLQLCGEILPTRTSRCSKINLRFAPESLAEYARIDRKVLPSNVTSYRAI